MSLQDQLKELCVGDTVILQIKDKIYPCDVIYKDAIEFQCQTKDRSPLFQEWTSLLFKNDSLVSNYGNAIIKEIELKSLI